MSIRAGQLRKRGLVQTRATTQDAIGGQATTWADLKTIWLAMVALSGRELELAQTRMAEVTHEFTARYDAIWAVPKVAATYRIVYNNRIFNLAPPSNVDERNREIVILAAEGLSDG